MRAILIVFTLLFFVRTSSSQQYDESVSAQLKNSYKAILHSDDKKRVKKLQSLLDSIQTHAPQYIMTCEKCNGTLHYEVSAQRKRCKGSGTVKHNVCTGTGMVLCDICEGKKNI